jgi:hypothetical protein
MTKLTESAIEDFSIEQLEIFFCLLCSVRFAKCHL